MGCYTARAGSERSADCIPDGRVPYGRDMKYNNAPCPFCFNRINQKYYTHAVIFLVNILLCSKWHTQIFSIISVDMRLATASQRAVSRAAARRSTRTPPAPPGRGNVQCSSICLRTGVVHLVRSTCHAISGRGLLDDSERESREREDCCQHPRGSRPYHARLLEGISLLCNRCVDGFDFWHPRDPEGS